MMQLLFPQTQLHSKLKFLFFLYKSEKLSVLRENKTCKQKNTYDLSQKHQNLYIAPITRHCIPKAAENLVKIKGSFHYTALLSTVRTTTTTESAEQFQGDRAITQISQICFIKLNLNLRKPLVSPCTMT